MNSFNNITNKQKINDKRGMALVGVIVLLFIASLMGTAIYAYSFNSMKSIRFASDRKKAEYLAQAGVEAVAFAYQKAIDSGDTATDEFISGASQKDSVITSNEVYLVWDSSNREYKYLTKENAAIYDEKNVIGYYVVTVFNEEKEYPVMLSSTIANAEITQNKKITAGVKSFTSVGHVGKNDIKRVKKAYIADPMQASNVYYGKNGIVNVNSLENMGTYTFPSTLKIDTYFFQLLYRLGAINEYPYSINLGNNRSTPIYMGYSAGNMILGTPTDNDSTTTDDADTITLPANSDNVISFIGMNDLFVKANIDVTPSKGKFNILFLRGNNIVVNGDIELFAYSFPTRGLSGVWAGIAGNYRLGTIILGTPSKAGTTVTDPYKHTDVYGFGACGRVYFGGNVFVNIEIPNVGTYRYKAFSAGTSYYFNDNVTRTTSEDDADPYGIDLLKYFLDYSIATKKYSENVLNRFENIRDAYYDSDSSTTTTTYVTANDNGTVTKDSMRLIDINNRGTTNDTYASIIPPDPTDSSALVWYVD